jgi:hypothetical protein
MIGNVMMSLLFRNCWVVCRSHHLILLPEVCCSCKVGHAVMLSVCDVGCHVYLSNVKLRSGSSSTFRGTSLEQK